MTERGSMTDKVSRGDRSSVLLIHPPYGDFTYPYHSPAYVAAPLKAAGYDVDVVDLNALWFRRVFTSERVAAWRAELLAEFEALDSRPGLEMHEQKRVAQLLQCLAICNGLEPERAVQTFRTEAFYDYEEYLWARSQVRAFEQLLSYLYEPYNFFIGFAVPPYEPTAEALAARAASLGRLTDDLTQLLREFCGEKDYLFCGVTFPFTIQLAPGLAAFSALEELFPDAYRVAGGTAISDIFKYKTDFAALEPFKKFCDFFYIGEAETGVVQFADWCRGENNRLPMQVVDLRAPAPLPLASLPYVSLTREKGGSFYSYSWVDNPPDYSWIDWDLYLAPERRVNYSPSRGCFWNQCTFCDYGLNDDGPTAPSRTMEAEVVVEHLRGLAKQGVNHVYLAVDAISPKFLDSFADALIKEKLDIHWSSQFFLTRQFTPAFVEKLAASGLRVASFGLESGSSRVLESMGKGKNRAEDILAPALKSFRASCVGLQPLFFFGFPGETDEDRQRTVSLLLDNIDIFITVTKGGLFDLLPGSIIAKAPEKFGVCGIRRRADDNIAGGLEYQMSSDGAPPACEAFARFNDQLPHWGVFERPWAGGIDTLHTQLYVERFGRDIFHRLREAYQGGTEPWGDVALTTSYNLHEILDNVVIHQAFENGAEKIGQVALQVADSDLQDLFAPMTPDLPARKYEIRFRQYREI
jgi:anaerobic magnesium-protoporphyrin IX monomethyl ester cyclase